MSLCCPFCGQKINKELENTRISMSDRFLYNIYVARRKKGEPAKKIILDLLSKIKISRSTFFRKLKKMREKLKNCKNRG